MTNPWGYDAAHRGMWLGTHRPQWVSRPDMPLLFVSRSELKRLKKWPEIRCAGVAVDSGGFTELARNGRWKPTVVEFAEFVQRCAEWGAQWVAPQDWMVEPGQLAATGHTLEAHQALTAEFYAQLLGVFYSWQKPELGNLVIPVLQGWTVDDYVHHIGMYERVDVDLEDRLVGVGSICRRSTREDIQAAADVLTTLASTGMRLHAFGIHRNALAKAFRAGALDWFPAGDDRWYPRGVVSWDSMAWSFSARRQRVKLPECEHPGLCGNCDVYALRWRAGYCAHAARAHIEWLSRPDNHQQTTLFEGAA